MAKRYYEQDDLQAQNELKELEEDVDNIVAELYEVTGEELVGVRKALGV